MAKSFRTRAEFRAWLEKHHAKEKELILRLYKVHAKDRGIGYREALDEALCFGWIDGVRRSLDDVSFTQRFTPRKPKSNWSAVNIKRVKELESEGLMCEPGLAAFRARTTISSAPYSFENRDITFDANAEKTFRANKRAWKFFQEQAPWYRRTTTFWVMSAKKEETRAKRLAELMSRCAKGARVGILERAK
jgi:uncharacterized protein YdeI (YjbR/CyaY-like superfamily)